MKLIPVIDLMLGQVVSASGGKRSRYLPSSTPLCSSSRPLAVVDAFLSLHPFKTLYIADLDSIEGRGSNLREIRSIHQKHPHLKLWIDDGLAALEKTSKFARVVIGSESLRSFVQYEAIRHAFPDALLSLDFRHDSFLGPDELLHTPASWPADVIVMELGRVGAAPGPGYARLEQLQRAAPLLRFYAAGGVRSTEDLENLQAACATGALLSTALHQLRIGRKELCRLDRTSGSPGS